MLLRRRESGCRGGEQGYEGDDELGHGWKFGSEEKMEEEKTKEQTNEKNWRVEIKWIRLVLLKFSVI